MPVTPSLFGNARVSYELAGRLPVIALAAHFSDRRLSDAGEDTGFSPLPYAPPALDLRLAVTGPFSHVRGLKYQLMSNYAFAPTGPYTAGPVSLSPTFMSAPELIPNVRLTVMFGLVIDLGLRR